QAGTRLEAEPPGTALEPLMRRLRRLAMTVRRRPATAAVALFVSERESTAVQLPIAVTDRVVVDPTFATRDLVRAIAHVPRHRVLVVSERAARLYEGTPGLLHEVTGGAFPLAPPADENRSDRSHRFGRDRARSRDAHVAAHLRATDDALAARRASDPLPL